LKKFVFGIHVRAEDRPLLEEIRSILGFGSITHVPPREEHWAPSVTLTIKSFHAHRTATIPFFDRFLLACKKREQYETWKRALSAYELTHNVRWGRGRSICRVSGCEKIVRGRGLCRSHYYRATGY